MKRRALPAEEAFHARDMDSSLSGTALQISPGPLLVGDVVAAARPHV
jgi:hypothetical protein